MKAFTLYPKEERDLRILLTRLQNYGKCNCDLITLAKLYNEWHMQAFPGVKEVNTSTANYRDDWFMSFVDYLTRRDI